jgi:hypothetical protein
MVETHINTHDKAPEKRVFRIRGGNGDELKCYGCGWRVTNLYVLATSKWRQKSYSCPRTQVFMVTAYLVC